MALTWGVNEDDKIVLANDDTGINPFASISSLCQGSPLWWVCQFMPTFHINQFAYNSIITGVYFDENATFNGGMDRLQESITSLEGINLFNLVKSSAMWKYYFSMPYVYIVVYFALYKIHEKYL